MIRIDAGCRCESRTIHVHLRCVYKNVTAFERVALPQVCLYLVSLAVLELKYRSPPGMSQYECAVHALVQTCKCSIEEVGRAAAGRMQGRKIFL